MEINVASLHTTDETTPSGANVHGIARGIYSSSSLYTKFNTLGHFLGQWSAAGWTVLPPALNAGELSIAAGVTAVLYPEGFGRSVPLAYGRRLTQELGFCKITHVATLLYLIPQSSLAAGFCGSGLPQGFEFAKFCLRESPLHQSNRVNVAKGRMVVVDGRDKRHVSA